jgi:hypothetical protein
LDSVVRRVDLGGEEDLVQRFREGKVEKGDGDDDDLPVIIRFRCRGVVIRCLLRVTPALGKFCRRGEGVEHFAGYGSMWGSSELSRHFGRFLHMTMAL